MNNWVGLTCISAAILSSVTVNAADENFDVYVFTDATYDDNVFRVANSAEALAQSGTTTRSDIETTFGVGANVKIPVSRQQFNVDAELRRTLFNRFDQLDNNNGELKGEWQWAYASRASGTLGYEYERGLTDFFEFQSASRDTIVDQNFYGSAKIPVHPRWTVVLGSNARDVDYDERPELDRDTTAIYAEALFQTRARTFVGVRLQESETEFDNNGLVNNDFDESNYSVVVRWNVTGKSRFAGSLGRTERDPSNAASGDFSGGTGQVEYRRIISGKTHVDFKLFRQTSLVDEIASLVVAEGAAVEPQWKISPKLTFRGELRYEERDFRGLTNSGRSDDLLSLRARLAYKLSRALTLNLGLGYQTRDSNVDDSEFDQTELSAGIRFTI